MFPGTDLKPFQSRRKHCNLTLKYKYYRIQMKKMFPSFDLGIGHLFPSEPEEKKQKKEEPHCFAYLDVSELDDVVVELKPSEDDKICNKIRSKRFPR